MSTRRWRTAAAAVLVAGSVTLLPVGIADADCTTAGDFGAGAGCSPPGDSSGSGNAESWPPTSVDWPPKLSSDSENGNGGEGGGKGGSGGSGGGQPTPIVMPNGQKPASTTPSSSSDSTSTSTTPKPIVPAGSALTGTTTSTTPTPIVTPQH
jgi:hypothetical protein